MTEKEDATNKPEKEPLDDEALEKCVYHIFFLFRS